MSNQQIAESEPVLLKSQLLSLRNLPLSGFIDCLLEGNLSVLGEGEPEELKAHWEALYSEFCDAISTSDSQGAISTDANIRYYEIKIAILQMLIDALQTHYHPILIQLLRDEGFSYEFTKESYLEDLELVVEQAQKWVIARDQLLRHKETTQGGDKTNIDYNYFATMLNSISTMVKYDVNDSISTLRFCRYYVQLIAHIEKQSNDGRG